MGAISNLDDLVNKLTGGNNGNPESIWFWKDARVGSAAATTPVSDQMVSLWQYEGYPCSGAAPTTVAIPDNTTPGSFQQTDPGGGRQKWLLGGAVMGATFIGSIRFHDRLLHIGSLDATVTTPQTVGGTITRNTGGTGNSIWIEIYAQIGNTATTISASYTNENGTAGRTTPLTTFGGNNYQDPQRLIRLPLQAGDKGVRSVQSVTITATTGTAGNFGVNIMKPLNYMGIVAAGGPDTDSLISDLPAIIECPAGACIMMSASSASAAILVIGGVINFIEA